MVGLNVVFVVIGWDCFIFFCFEVYIGVMIDDLIICGVFEFYCMFMLWVEYCFIL